MIDEECGREGFCMGATFVTKCKEEVSFCFCFGGVDFVSNLEYRFVTPSSECKTLRDTQREVRPKNLRFQATNHRPLGLQAILAMPILGFALPRSGLTGKGE